METLVPIPNTKVKNVAADGSAATLLCESRSSPGLRTPVTARWPGSSYFQGSPATPAHRGACPAYSKPRTCLARRRQGLRRGGFVRRRRWPPRLFPRAPPGSSSYPDRSLGCLDSFVAARTVRRSPSPWIGSSSSSACVLLCGDLEALGRLALPVSRFVLRGLIGGYRRARWRGPAGFSCGPRVRRA